MTKIESAAQELKQIRATRAMARAFFSRAIKDVKKAKKQRDNAVFGEFFDRALGSAKALLREGFFPSQDGVPFMFEFSKAYLSAEEGNIGASLGEFFDAVNFHDFLICETEFLRDFLVLALFYNFLSGDGEQKRRAADSVALIDTISFDGIYFKYTKVHSVFAAERAGFYEKCSPETVRFYDEMLLEKYGNDEVSSAEMLVEKADAEGEHVGKYLMPSRSGGGSAYFWLLGVLTAGAFFVVLLLSDAVTALVALLPCYVLAKGVAVMFFERTGSFLPALSSGDEIEKTKCAVAVTTLLCGESTDGEIFDNVEDFYLSNRQDNFVFAVLGDLPEADRKHVSSDAAVIKYASSRIRALNEKYGGRFALFIRRRRYAVCEKKYFGWERKRGAVLEFCRFASGDVGSYETVINGDEARGAKYLLTLDGDTRIGIGGVRKLLGIMLHPQNRAKIGARGAVVSGYGIVQPKTITSLEASSKTLFASVTGGDGGVDRYSQSSFELYQDVFGTGIFCGKGMIDISAFLSVCDGFFPRERILSHDLLEGALARAATAKCVVQTDGTPSGAISYFSRLDRWLRGDLQALSYIFGTVKNEAGEKIKNPMSDLSRFQILDNILRAAAPLFSITLVALCAAAGNYFAVFPLLSVVLPALCAAAKMIAAPRRQSRYSILSVFKRVAADLFFRVSSAAARAGIFLHATVNVIYSAIFSKRGFLSWTTAAQAERSGKGGIVRHYAALWTSVAVGAAFLILPAPAKALGALWIAFPAIMLALGKKRRHIAAVSPKSRAALLGYAADMWRFFAENVGEETNHLPPDNVQLSPARAVAMRTSPTNIGLYFLSMLAARDLKIIDTDELFRRASAAAASLNKMSRWNGHLYNWYDLETLSVIGTPFVSTVDSGNFVTSLVAFCEGITEYASENVGLIDVRNALVNFIYSADFGALINQERGFLSVGFNVSEGKLAAPCYDTLMSEARTTAYFAETTGQVPAGYMPSLGRRLLSKGARLGAYSWSGTAFEYFMPSLLTPSPENSLMKKSLSLAFSIQEKNAFSVPGKGFSVFGVSESCFFEFDGKMNYQYRAFGLDTLSLDPKNNAERVVSPYSSFLMLGENAPRVMQNLERLKSAGMYGRYGFYEALDLDARRVGDGYAIIKCFMSHHVGMSIVAAANSCLGGIFVDRFMRNAQMRACRGLFSEKMPTTAKASPKKEKKPAPPRIRAPRADERENSKKRPPTLLLPDVHMLSNNKTRVVVSSSGHVAVFDGADVLIPSPFERLSLGGGMNFCALVDGKIVSAAPLGHVSGDVSSRFDFTCADETAHFRSSHTIGRKKVGFDVVLRLYANEETIEIAYKLTGDFENARMMLYFEPAVDGADAYEAHKSFSNLFISSKFFPDERVLVFERRPRSEGKMKKYLGVYADPPMAPEDFDTMREEILPLMYGSADIAALAGKDGGGRTGAVIVPACATRSRGSGGRTRRATFRIGYSQSSDDLLYSLPSPRGEYAGKLMPLWLASSGADATVRSLEGRLLYKFAFPPESKMYSNEALLRALSKKPVHRDGLWRHGISGDQNIVCADAATCDGVRSERLGTLLRLYKYCCIRGLRFDLVILFEEIDSYAETVKKTVAALIFEIGLSAFVGCDGGIFLLDGGKCTDGERFVLTECAAAYFDLSARGDIFASDAGLELSDEMTQKLKCAPRTEISDVPLPDRFRGAIKTRGGYATDDGFIVEKDGMAPPMAHVISSPDFGTVLTENSLGFTFFHNSALGKITPHSSDNMREDGGERVIIRVYGASGGDYTDHDAAACAKYVYYSAGSAEYFGTASGVGYVIKVSLCGDQPAKKVEILLTSDAKTRVKIIYLANPCLGAAPKNRDVAVFFDAERRRVSFSPIFVRGERELFGSLVLKEGNVGFYGDEASLLTDKAVFGGAAVAAISDDATFSGGHRCEFYLCCSDDGEKMPDPAAFSDEKSGDTQITPRVLTGDKLLDSSVNFWLPYQTLASRINARAGFYQVGGAYGFRDQLQDVISLIPYNSRLTREHIVRAASHQYEEGSVMHWWHEFGDVHSGIRSRCSDDSAWLAFTLSEYVKKTGDSSIIDVMTPYLSSPPLASRECERYERAPFSSRSDTVLNHALLGLERTFRTGAHGLPLIGTGDWNDGMNNVGRRGRGESVWLAFFSAICASRLAPLVRSHGFDGKAQMLGSEAARLISASKNAFDGDRFIRGYYDGGEPLGARGSDECEIDVMPQAFAAIAASEVDGTLAENARTALKTARDILFDREHSIFCLLWPPFDDGDQSPGYIKGYVPGIRENGGQYTHAAVFAALGMLRVGMNHEAAELLFAINPMINGSPYYKIEPYVLAGDVYSNPACAGRGGWSWYTGAAGWYRTVFIEELCGYRQRGDRFSICPRLSDLFPSFTLEVRRGGTLYTVRASMADTDFCVLDGKASENEFFFDGREHSVEIYSTGASSFPKEREGLDILPIS